MFKTEFKNHFSIIFDVLAGSHSANALVEVKQNKTPIIKEKYLKSIMPNNRLITLIVLILANWSANARDYGTNGHTHQIIEQPFLEMINERLQKVDIDKERVKMEQVAKERIHNPAAIEHIKPAVKNHRFYYDPTYVLDEDAVLPCGKVLYKAGTKVNPLEHIDLNRRLFFVDSRERDQVQWLKTMLKDANATGPEQMELMEDKIILVGGSPLELEKELGVSVYFDQQGALTHKFGIKHSPSLLEQEGLRLKIEEIALYKK